MASKQQQISLHCCICPKKPDFSDLSHLLTHVASKGHLLQVHNAKIQAKYEPEVKALLERYNEWHARNNIDGLVSQRLRLKNNKRKSRSDNQKTASTPNIWETKRGPLDTISPGPFFEDKVPTIADRLNETVSTPNELASSGLFVPESYPRPRMFIWPTDRPGAFEVRSLLYSSPPKVNFVGVDSREDYPSPELRLEPYPSPMNYLEDDNSSNVEFAKLKGVLWPGMDIFDSATPEMRRKRNQKKDVSVIEQLEHHSQEVEPIEKVYTHSMASFKRELPITGQPEESSPTLEPKTLPRSRNPSKFPRPLANRDVNNGRRRSANVNRQQHGFNGRKAETNLIKSEKAVKPKKPAFNVYDERDLPVTSQPSLRYSAATFNPATGFTDQSFAAPAVYRSAHDSSLQTFPQSLFANAFYTLQGSLVPMGGSYYDQVNHHQSYNVLANSGFASQQHRNLSSYPPIPSKELFSDDHTIPCDSDAESKNFSP